MDKVLVSIVMPVYNSELYLDKSINSILNQTFENFELIVIDDNSSDNSREVIEKYLKIDSRIRLLDNNIKGVSNARNLGMSECKGIYVTFMDADDYLAQDALEKMYHYIVNNNCDMCMCGFWIEGSGKGEKVILPYENGRIFTNSEIKSEIIPDMIYASKGKKKIMGSVWRLLIRKNLILSNDIKFNPKIHIAEDLLFCIETFSKCTSLVTTKECFYHYIRYRNTSLEKYRENFLEESLYFYSEFEKVLRKSFIFDENRRNFYMSKFNMYTSVISNNFRYDSPKNYKLRKDILKRVRQLFINDKQIKMYIKETELSKFVIFKLIKYNMCDFLVILFGIKEKIRIHKNNMNLEVK